MVPRADIVAVQQDIPLGELVKVFENAGHSRLVVYNDTLDDAVGMVHIRDLIAFMTARAADEPPRPIRRAQEAVPGRPRSQGRRSGDAAVGDQDRARDPVRAAVDAGDRSARQDAGDAHPSGAGGRRIWRHRRPRLDRGHRRADRRRHRRRARRGRGARRGAPARRLVPRRRARQPRGRRARSSARNSTSASRPRRSTRSAAISPPASAACRCAASSSRARAFEIEVLDADPRRVKRLNIYRSTDRERQRPRDARRRACRRTAPLTPPELPLNRDAR